MKKTKIEWTHAEGYAGMTWNPFVGCSKVSSGCLGCYALPMSRRLSKNPKTPWYKDTVDESGNWSGKLVRSPDNIFNLPVQTKKKSIIFVDSMGDLFHESLSDNDIAEVFDVMIKCPQHVFLVLTKRAERMKEFINKCYHYVQNKLPDNIWLGVSAEDQETFDYRYGALANTKVRKRFLSLEPLLGPIKLFSFCYPNHNPWDKNIGWVIVGGESGKRGRPMHKDWPLSIRNECLENKVPFFFKQWGEWCPGETIEKNKRNKRKNYTFPDGTKMRRMGKNKSGSLLEGKTWKQFPNFTNKEQFHDKS